MQVRRFTLRAFVPGLLLFVLLFSVPALAAPTRQAEPPDRGLTTSAANLRSGPGTTFAKVGSVPEGKSVVITGCNKACDWYQLEGGAWIAAFLVDPLAPEGAEQASAAPAAIPTATAVPAATTAQASRGASATSDGNLRAGPGTTFARVGGVTEGQTLEITGKTAAGDWYQLADGNWIAAILVVNPPAGVAVVASAAEQAQPPTPAGGSSAATSEDVMQEAMRLWQDRIDLNTTKTCGHFEYKLTDVGRKKSVWLFNREYVAQGEWLLVFVEVKNISPGTSHFGEFGPRLATLTPDGMMSQMTGDFKASAYAGWMFQHGGFYEDINPGQVLGIVEAYDLPLQPDMILGLGLLDCPDDMLSLGVWSKVPPARK